jgi:hypothetical protein
VTPTVFSTERNDTLFGTNSRDIIIGMGGDDTIRRAAGMSVHASRRRRISGEMRPSTRPPICRIAPERPSRSTAHRSASRR